MRHTCISIIFADQSSFYLISFYLNIIFRLVMYVFYIILHCYIKINEITMRKIQFLTHFSLFCLKKGFRFCNIIIEIMRSFSSHGKSKPVKTHMERYNYIPVFIILPSEMRIFCSSFHKPSLIKQRALLASFS